MLAGGSELCADCLIQACSTTLTGLQENELSWYFRFAMMCNFLLCLGVVLRASLVIVGVST